ncbi:MAG TPA: CBS domain-containing protein [Nitrososphaeraceae archaeon]|nr:CBS domain-containing protein [Nitrososphaeraceae archaeon]
MSSSAENNIKNVTVSDFMTREVKTITENETLKQACKLMYQDNIGSIVVLKKDTSDYHDEKTSISTESKNDKPVGMITERDIARMVGFSDKFFIDISVMEVMSKPLITINPDNLVKDAVALMEQKNIRRLPVMDDTAKMVGIITSKDILKVVMRSFKEIMKNKELISDGFDLLGLLGVE